MRTLTSRHVAITLGVLLAGTLVHCGGESSNGNGNGNNNNDNDGGSSGLPGSSSGQTSSGGGDGGGKDGAACTAKTCAETEQCGSYDDGCGGTIRCEASCRCTANDFETTCPPRPCEVVSGCLNQVCQYSAVACGAAGAERACAPVACDGEGCGNVATTAGDDQKLYACGGSVCAAMYCDPTATVTDGVVSYQNRCVPPPAAGCGSCGLGASSCNQTTDRFDCAAVPVPVVEAGGVLECDSTVAGSSFVYVDVEYTQGASDGSRQRPYTTYTEALNAAQQRNARGIVIAGSPVFTDPLSVINGISVYGGFDAAPDFVPNRVQRPKWTIPATARQGTLLRGAVARDITLGTALYHLEISTERILTREQGQGVSNVGLWAENATALQLVEMIVHAGDAADGEDGADGVAGSPGGPGGAPAPGSPGASCAGAVGACTLNVVPFKGLACGSGGAVIAGASLNQAGRSGAPVSDNAVYGANNVMPGAPVGVGQQSTPSCAFSAPAFCTNVQAGAQCRDTVCTSANARTGGAPGASQDEDGCGGQPNLTTEGQPGIQGADAAAKPGAAAGNRTRIDGVQVAVQPRVAGGNGEHGGRATGGGAGGGYIHDCMNDPNLGGAGGGGGGLGCGGTGGGAGAAGGFSMAIAVVGASQNLRLRNCVLTAGDGGNGGDAGAGGAGGGGGTGGIGAAGQAVGTPGTFGKKGGNGGRGGNGGKGGDGAPGAGGDSFAVWCATSSMNVSRDAATTTTPGVGGQAGESPSVVGNPGLANAVGNCAITQN